MKNNRRAGEFSDAGGDENQVIYFVRSCHAGNGSHSSETGQYLWN